jgi:hypothetical protein
MQLKWQTQLSLILVALALIGGGYVLWKDREHQRQIGAITAQLHQADSALAVWQERADSLAQAYHIDTVRLTYYRSKVDTLSVDVERWKRDTIQVVRYVALADSTVKACTLALHDCEARVGAVQHALDASQTEVRLLKLQVPPPSRKWQDRAYGALAGYLLFRATK